MEKRWYVVQTYAGYENKVMTNLLKRIETMNMQDKIFRVLIPEEKEVTIKDGVRKEKLKKTFPGYVLVEMIDTDDSWYMVRNTPGVLVQFRFQQKKLCQFLRRWVLQVSKYH